MTNLEKMIDGKTPMEAAEAVADFMACFCQDCPLHMAMYGGNGYCSAQRSSRFKTCGEVKREYLREEEKNETIC